MYLRLYLSNKDLILMTLSLEYSRVMTLTTMMTIFFSNKIIGGSWQSIVSLLMRENVKQIYKFPHRG